MAEGTNVFEGTPDGRQGISTTAPVSRFRPTYRALTDEEKQLHDAIKTQAESMENLFSHIKDGRYKALALTALEESVMWAIKELTGAGMK